MDIIDYEGLTLEELIKKKPDRKILEMLKKRRPDDKDIDNLLKKLIEKGSW